MAAVALAAPTLHLIGDSTMADKPKGPANPETGWGQALPALLKPEAGRVVNYAMNGRSTKSFIDEGRWTKVVAALQPGDFVIIQFGHNDEKADKPAVYAAPRGASTMAPMGDEEEAVEEKPAPKAKGKPAAAKGKPARR